MKVDLDRIEELAKKATPGKRCVEDPLDQNLSIVLAGKETYEWWFLANCMLPDEDDHDFTTAEVKANAGLIAELDRETVLAMTRAIRAAQRIDTMCNGESFDRFEAVAAMFKRDTGITRPGKDIPAASAEDDNRQKRQAVFEAWWTKQFNDFHEALAPFSTAHEGGR